MEMRELINNVREFMTANADNATLLKNFREAMKDAMKLEKGDGRKEQVVALLREHGRLSIREMAELLGMTDKNISSQLSYLRKDGIKIATDSEGRKFIEE